MNKYEIMKARHDKASSLIQGSEIACPTCGKRMIKKTATHIFCSKSHCVYYTNAMRWRIERAVRMALRAEKIFEPTINPFRDANGNEIDSPEKFLGFMQIGDMAHQAAYESRRL